MDFGALREAADFFRSKNLPVTVVLTPALTVKPEEELRKLDADLDEIETLLKNDPTATATIALDFRVGGYLLRLTMSAIREGLSLEPLVGLVRLKIEALKVASA